MQYGVYEPLNDRLGAAICTGTGFIVRTTALIDIGGWPQIVPSVDIAASTLLNPHGWKVAYVQEQVQVGLGPESWEAAVNQKMRWVSPHLLLEILSIRHDGILTGNAEGWNAYIHPKI